MLMAIFPQVGQSNNSTSPLIFNHITRSWPYLFISIYLLISLGLVTIRRTTPLRKRNIGFLVNHAGLWIAIVAGSIGSSDLQRLTINMKEGDILWKVRDNLGAEQDLGFAMKLIDFKLDEYEAKIGLLDYKKSELILDQNNQTFYATQGNQGKLSGHSIKVLNYYPTAGKVENRWEPFVGFGAPPAALVEITDPITKEKSEAWLTCGNFMYNPEYVKLDSSLSIIMIPPEAKSYQSLVHVVYGSRNDTAIIEVNKPLKAKGWKIYQVSYNEKLGRYSDTSVFELIRDPWLPAVYVGIFLMMAGAVYLLLSGKRREV
jgi:hypothetical protein